MPNWLQAMKSVDLATAVAESSQRTAARLGRVPWLAWYPVALLLFALVMQLKSPIVVGDTDMWYHLSGGRYFWSEGRPPHTPFFSFNEPAREWVNYYWGFQAIIYRIYETGGYLGLVVTRSLLSVMGLLAIWRFIAPYRATAASPLLLLALFALFVILMDGRAYQLRPHLVSYALIPAFLYVLEHRPRYAPLLPLAMVLWVNLHGVEYVVGGLVLGAYLVDHVVRRSSRASADRIDWRYVGSIAACAPALLVNPFGPAILGAPFAHAPDLSEYVSELRPIPLETFYTVVVAGLGIGPNSTFALLVSGAAASAVALAMRGRLRLAHVILAIGGVLLLLRGNRFIWEWALLTLPLLASGAAAVRGPAQGARPTGIALAAALLVMATPFFSLAKSHGDRGGYPFRADGLPTGIVQFARQHDLAGNVVMNPTLAGYVHWELSPAMRVYADMELPPFDDWDMFRIFSASREAAALNRLLAEHSVDFLLVEVTDRRWAGHAKKLADFAPVFFDDVMVLFAHRGRQTDVVERHELKSVNPFNLLDGAQPLQARLEELQRVAGIHLEGNRVNHAVTRLLFDQKRYAEAEAWAERFRTHHPTDPNALYLTGNVLENTERCEAAIQFYERAFETSDHSFEPELHKHLGTCHYVTKDFATAYSHFRKGVNIYLRSEPAETLYQYAFSSVIVGDTARARQILRAILYELPDDDDKMAPRARGLLEKIDSDPSLSSDLPAWVRAMLP